MLTKLRLFVKEYWMEITITVCVALGTLFFGWFFTLTGGKPDTFSWTWAILFIGLFFFLIALFCCYKIIRKEARQESEREKREIEREQREIQREKRDEERFNKENTQL